MPRMQYRVTLTPEERTQVTAVLRRGTASAFTQRRARVLLQTDRTRPVRLTDAQVADACAVSSRLVARARADWCARGMASLQPAVRATPPVPPKLDAAATTRLLAVACSTPPAGQARWSLRLLADRVVELAIVPAISHETVRQTLKKTPCSPGARSVL